MSMAMPGTAAKGSTFSLFGKKISWDALLVAGAGIAGVILLYKAGQPGAGALGSAAPTDPTGASSSLTDFGSTALTDPTVPLGNYAPVYAGMPFNSFANSPAQQSSNPAAPALPTPVQPVQNYNAAYAASAGPVAVAPAPAAGSPSFVPRTVQFVLSALGAPAPSPAYVGAGANATSFNPVMPRSSGTRAV